MEDMNLLGVVQDCRDMEGSHRPSNPILDRKMQMLKENDDDDDDA